jgi:DNA-binding NtrC family response regulator
MATQTKQSPAKILVVDDDPVTVKHLRRTLRGEGYEVTTAVNGREAFEQLEAGIFDVVLTDLVMGEVDGLEVLDRVKAIDPETEVVVITGHASVDSAIEAIRRHAFHYLQKPLHLEEVRHITRQALEKRRLRGEVTALRSLVGFGHLGILGNSQKIIELRRLLRQVARSGANVLITGESGTGKELAASAIHRLSPRANEKFLAINCASFTEELLANELFGHEKGAFTGASTTRRGLLESANGGTMFFDEVGEMPPAMQATLLRAIQERELIRVGGQRPIRIDVRIIAATNQDLKKSMQLGVFRQDLYYRLAVVPVHLPTLAERKEDISLLAQHFLARFNANALRPIRGFTDAALEVLRSYDFPGNVRELENIVERSAALARAEIIDVYDLPEDLLEIETFTFHRQDPPMRTLASLEQEYIRWVLERCDHNKSRAATILGIDRVSLYRKLKRTQLLDE